MDSFKMKEGRQMGRMDLAEGEDRRERGQGVRFHTKPFSDGRWPTI